MINLTRYSHSIFIFGFIMILRFGVFEVKKKFINEKDTDSK